MKRTFLIIIVVLALIGVVIGIYFLFFAPKGGVVIETPTNPFGGAGEYVPPTGESPNVGETLEAGEEVAPRFIRITEGPVAFGTNVRALEENIQVEAPNATGTSTVSVFGDTEVRYVERASGNIYAYKVKEQTLTRLTNQTLPGIQKAFWTPDGAYAFVQFLSEDAGLRIETYALPANGEDGYFLEPGLSDIVLSGANRLLTLLPSTTGSVATYANRDGTNVKTLFSSPLSQLRMSALGDNHVAYTRASANIDGYGFLVNGTTGNFERVLGPLPGLSMIGSPGGTSILAGYRSGNTVRLDIIDSKTREVVALPVATLPEKCVWTADESAIYCAIPRSLPSGLPDSWYQGVVSFSDRIWKIDLSTRLATLIVDPLALAETNIDAVSLSLGANTDVLIFTNRTDGSLWLYDL